MIAAFVTLFQLVASTPAAPSPDGPLIVKDASRSISVALVATADGPLLRAEHLRPVIPVTVSHLMADRWLLIVNNAAIEVEPGTRLARAGDDSYQLAAAPELRKGALYVPLQLVVEIMPRVAGNLVWDAARFELRAFSSVNRFADREGKARGGRGLAAAGAPRSSSRRAAERAAPSVAATSLPVPLAPLRSRHLVVVDAGHGGPDAGMRGPISGGPQVVEKNVTLNAAKHVGQALLARGVDVKYTRTTDTLIALSDRGKMANDAHADLFVSIHVNAANPGWKDPGAARGFETYFLAEAKTEDARRVEQMENEVVKFETKSSAQAGDPLSFILNDMAQNEHLRESNELADLIQRHIAAVHPAANRGVKQAGFRVLVTAFMPAVLVEIGFGTNAEDAAYMTDPARMEALSGSIADAVVAYLKRYQRRVTATRTGGIDGGHRPE